ncbi:MAG TPA: CehA/McbA family metallohydrolase [Polyangiaceae bacterium]|nr:CehA/McbA family metallohydrolase [Polyangiaceae bacterium]
MWRRGIMAVLAVTLAAGVGWVALGGTAQRTPPRTPPLPYRQAGVTVSSVPAGGLAAGEAIDGASGDLLVQNGRLSYVMGGNVSGTERQARHGALLDLALKDFHADELLELRTIVRLGGKPLIINVVAVTLVTDSTYPFLSVEQVSRDGYIRLATEFRAAPQSNVIQVITRLHNAGPSIALGVEIGERTRWPGASTFAPRLGFPKHTSRAEVSWIARQGERLSYALAFPEGPAEAAFFFDRIGQLGQETLSRLGNVAAGATLVHRRDLIAVEGSLSAAAELAFRSLGKKVGRVEGVLQPAPAWAIVEALFPDGKPALSVRAAANGQYVLPLPTGDYRLVLRSPGGEDEAEVSVEAGKPPVTPVLLAPVPGRLRFVVTDDNGAALAARLLLRGIAPTKDPELGPVERGSGARNVVYTRTGEGEIELPPGRYRVVVTHGSEYELLDQEVEVDGDTGATLRGVLPRVVETGGWVACDFHLHAAPSHDSNVSLEDRVLSLLAEGVEFAVATDHNEVTDYSAAVAHHRAEDELGTASGVEITTGTWGHFNAYPYPVGAPPPAYSRVTPLEIFAAVRARAPFAVIQVNHPRMPGVGYFNRIELNRQTGVAEAEDASLEFDAVEVVNGYDLESGKLIDENLQEYFLLLNFGHRYTATGNSDSHRLIINWAGYPRTYVRIPDDRVGSVDPLAVARAVREGHAMVSNGIFLAVAANGTGGPGDTVSGRRLTLQVEARAPSWVDVKRFDVWVNGVLAASHRVAVLPPGARRVSWDTELELRQDAWVVVIARGDQPMSQPFFGRRVLPFAFTNPIYADADGDGLYRAPDPLEPQPR